MKGFVSFVIIIILLLSAGILLLVNLYHTGDSSLYISEGIFAVCLVLLIYVYFKLIRPIDTIANGIDLLREQDFSSRLASVGEYHADRIVEMFNRMMAQLKEERLHVREQNHFLDLIVEASPMGIVTLDSDGSMKMLNPAAKRFLEIPEGTSVEGQNIRSLPGALAGKISMLSKGETETFTISDSMIYRCSSLSYIDKGYSHPFILIESMTKEIISAEKRVYEKVIRMLAHEVNNSIGGVISMLDTVGLYMKEENTSDDDRMMMSEVIHTCSERCMAMTKFITAIAAVVKIPEPIKTTLDLNQLITDSRLVMESMCLPRGISLHIEHPDTPVNVSVDRVLIDQVFINILKNAVESIGHDGDVWIKITDNNPTVTITDNGKGISPQVKEKLFSPFFSSKPNGQGLGLIFIRDVLDKHGCRFSLATGEDGLTRFTIKFPPI